MAHLILIAFAASAFLPDAQGLSKSSQEFSKRDIKPCPNGELICENVDDYPEAQLREILENSNGEYNEILGRDSLHEPVEIETRDDMSLTMSMCDATEQIIFPQRGQNTNYSWFDIINLSGYEQGVRVEICKSHGSKCHFSKMFPLGYEATCKQNYIHRKLLAADNTATMAMTEFLLPSCCSCSVKLPDLV